MDEPKAFWTFDGTTIEEWTITSRTARTFKVRGNSPYYQWTRTVMASAIGKRFHTSPSAAMAAAISTAKEDIDRLKQRLQMRRSALGVYESLLKKVGEDSACDVVGQRTDHTDGQRA